MNRQEFISLFRETLFNNGKWVVALTPKLKNPLLIYIYQTLKDYTAFLPDDVKPSERYYCLINDINELKTCKMCNNRVKFNYIQYRKYCSNICQNRDVEVREVVFKKIKDRNRLLTKGERQKRHKSKGMLGRQHSEETKEKIRKSHKGVSTMTEEGRKKISESNIRRLISQNKEDTRIEKKIRDILNEKQISFIPQYQVGRFLVDFFIPDLNLIIEAYGDYWHLNPKVYNEENYFWSYGRKVFAKEKWEADKKRKIAIEKRGFKVVELWERDIMNKDFALDTYLM